MSNIESRVLVIKNSLSGNRTVDRRAEAINNCLRHVEIKDFTQLQKDQIRQVPQAVIILGGDGTVQASIAWLKAHDELPTLIIAGGGTGNIFRKNLTRIGAILSLNDIRDSDKLAETALSFSPAVIKEGTDEKSIFVIGAGFGKFERDYAKYRETVRQLYLPAYLKRKTSQLLAVLTTGISLEKHQEKHFLHLYSTGPMLHGIKIFSDQELSLDSTNIGLAEIEDENPQMAIIKFLYAVSLWRLGKKPSPLIASTQVSSTFSYSPGQEGSRVSLDGEIRHLNANATLTIGRSNTKFPIVALI